MDQAEATLRAYKLMVWENVATLAATVGITLGLYAMGAGGWSMWGLVCMFNLNTPKSACGKTERKP